MWKKYRGIAGRFRGSEISGTNDGTPYETGYPPDELVYDMDYHGKKVLIVQQQVIGSAIREEIQKSKGCTGDSCKAGL